MSAAYQWGKAAGFKHAFVPYGEGVRSVCTRARVKTVTEQGGLSCGPCHQSVWWYERTGHADYLKPHAPNFDMEDTSQDDKPQVSLLANKLANKLASKHSPVRHVRYVKPKPTIAPIHEVYDANDSEAQDEARQETQQETEQKTLVVDRRPTEPESMLDYAKMPYAEQRYWAPVMLAKLGTPEVWDQTHESAEAFQDRCYEHLVNVMKA